MTGRQPSGGGEPPRLLGLIGPAAAAGIPALLGAIRDPDPHVQSVVATALPAVGAPVEEALPLLVELLDGENRRTASRALSEYGADAAPALDPLIAILTDPSLPSEDRWNAARTIGKIRAAATSAVPILVEHLADDAPTVREHCAEALGDIGPTAAAAVGPLIGVLDDPATRVRRDAARSLGQIGVAGDEVVTALVPLLKDSEAIVRDATRTALLRLDPEMELPEE